MSNGRDDTFKKLRDDAAASDQMRKLTQTSIMGLKVGRLPAYPDMVDKLRENFNHLLVRMAELEEARAKKGECNMKGRMEDIEHRVSAIEEENETWHK